MIIFSTLDFISSAVARQYRHGLCALKRSLNPPNNCAPTLSADVYAKKFCSVPLTVKEWPVPLKEVEEKLLITMKCIFQTSYLGYMRNT